MSAVNLRLLIEECGLTESVGQAIDHSLLSTHRIEGILRAAREIENLDGDTAEIGCAAGGTSRLIALRCRRRHWACDTFVGLVDVCEHDDLKNGKFRSEHSTTKRRLADLRNVEMVRGRFPDSAPEKMRSARFALVHIDVDTYRSIKDAFGFFAGRMTNGGVVVLDDVIGRGTAGGKRAWGEISAGDHSAWAVIEENDPQIVVRFAST